MADDPDEPAASEESAEQLLEQITTRREEVPILLDVALLAEHVALERRLAEAVQYDATVNEPPTSPAIAAELIELEERIAAAAKIFVVEGIGTTAWYDLAAHHPPAPADRKLGALYEWRTFRPAAVAATVVQPKLTVEQATTLMAKLPASEWEKLWHVVSVVNAGGDTSSPKSELGSAVLRLNGRSSATPPNGGSLAEPSSGDAGEPSPTTSTTPTDG